MKTFATSLDVNNEVCSYITSHHLPYYDETSIDDCDFISVHLRFHFNYEFDKKTYKRIVQSQKPIVIFDYLEYGDPAWHEENAYSYLHGDRVFGYKWTAPTGCMLNYPEFVNLINGLKAAQPQIKCYFMREMSKLYDYTQCPFPVYPIDYCLADKALNVEIQSKEDYFKRQIKIMFNWGNTCVDRRIMQWRLYKYCVDKNINIADTEEQLKRHLAEKSSNIICLFHRDYHERIDINQYYAQSKVIIDVGGCGVKCFRNTQSAMYAASTKHICNLQFAYPWEDMFNCIELKVTDRNEILLKESINKIHKCLNSDKDRLYAIYVNGVENARNYISKTYINKYVNPRIYENIKPK